jgi:hypothetical protein
MSRPAIAIAAAILIGAAVLSFRPIYEPDLWWHLAHGREDVSGRIVRTNVFSFNFPDYRQRYTTWLFDSTAYLAWTAGGGAGIQVLQAFLIALTLVLAYGACRIRAPASATAAVLAIAFVVLEPRAIPRPHLASFAGMAACTLLIERAARARSPRPLLWSIPLVALWSNLHVECVFGVVLIGLFAAGELAWPASLTRRDALLTIGITAICAVMTMANPYGWGLIAYLYENLSVPRIMRIAELGPPYLPDYRAFFLYLAVLGVALAAQPRRIRVWELLAALTFGAFGAMHIRLTPLVLLATAPLVAERLASLAARGIDPRAILITSCCAALAVSRIALPLLATGFAIGDRAVEPEQFFSREAVAFMTRNRLEGPVFNSHNLGGYLAWTRYPEVRIFQDSRLQAYPPEHFRAIIQAYESQSDWNALVAGVDWAVLSVPRPNQLSGDGRFPVSEWGTVFEDAAMEMVVRRSGRYGGLIGRR